MPIDFLYELHFVRIVGLHPLKLRFWSNKEYAVFRREKLFLVNMAK